MKKSNLILQAAIAAALASSSAAYAGTLAGASTFATENFGPTSTATNVPITPGAVTYTYSTPGGIVINPGGSIYMTYRVANGLFAAAPTTAVFTGTAITGLLLTPAAVVSSADSTTITLTLTNSTTNANVTIGVGTTIIFTPAAGAFNGVNTTLATAGGVVNMQAAVATTTLGAGTSSNTGVALPADLDGGLSNTLALATAAEAITPSMAASSAFPFNAGGVTETQRIDLAAVAGPALRFTVGANIGGGNVVTSNLGAFRFVENAGTQGVATAAGTDYTIAGRVTATTMSGTVTGSFKTGSTMTLTTDAACAVPLAAGSAGVLNAGLNTFTFTAATVPAAGANTYVCYTVPATTGQIPVTVPVLTMNVGTKGVATDAADTATGNLLNLQLNGSQTDVRSYVPVGNTGYTSWIRVINTGSIAASITGQFLNADGTTGTAGTLIASLPAGGSQSMTANQVEAAIGAPTGGATARPRLRVTAPTNGMNVQSFISNPDGSITDMTGAQ